MKKNFVFVFAVAVACLLCGCVLGQQADNDVIAHVVEEPAPPVTEAPAETVPMLPEAEDNLPEEEPEVEPVETESVVEQVFFGEDITMEYKGFVDDGEHMSHYFFEPSIESEYDIPLVVWLHGSGECGVGSSIYEQNGIMPTLLNWKMAGVNAYIACPQLVGAYNQGRWNVDRSVDNVKALIDHLVETYNIDTNRIYLVGHSLGGQGTMYLAAKMPGYFAAAVSLSPYHCGLDLAKEFAPDCTVIAITGGYGLEDQKSLDSARVYGDFIGHQNIYRADSANHQVLPSTVFGADEDDNNRADIFEWMFEHERIVNG